MLKKQTWFRSSLVAILIVFGSLTKASDTIYIEANTKFTSSISLNPYTRVFRTAENITASEAYKRITSHQLEEIKSKTSLGFQQDYFWILFSLHAEHEGTFSIELDNPHIDSLAFYSIQNNQPELVAVGGDKIPFDHRNIKNRRFIFPIKLEANTPATYLLLINKRYASVSFPLRLWEHDYFEYSENRANLLHGLYFGILVFVGILSLFTGFILWQYNFISYAFYVLTLSLYFFTQLGFSFQFLYPESIVLNNYTRSVIADIWLITSIDFFRRLLKFRDFAPRLFRALSFSMWFLIALAVFWILYKEFDATYYQFSIFALNTLYAFALFLILAIFYVLIISWKAQPKIALLISLAFLALSVGAVLYILIEYGLLSESLFKINPIQLGSIIEIIILSGAMIFQIKTINENKNKLKDQLALQQNKLMQEYIRGGEMERERIAAELHDHIGSTLSLLKKKVGKQTGSTKEIDHEFDMLCEDIRRLSFQMIPHDLVVSGFRTLIQKHVNRFCETTHQNVNIQFIDFPEVSGQYALHLFRIIQEGLQNIAKHATATEIDLQFIGHEHELVITLDDNGKGFDSSQVKNGSGMFTMKSRTELLEGKFEYSSQPGKGTQFMIQVPLPNQQHDQPMV